VKKANSLGSRLSTSEIALQNCDILQKLCLRLQSVCLKKFKKFVLFDVMTNILTCVTRFND